jgi:hypothetical protein
MPLVEHTSLLMHELSWKRSGYVGEGMSLFTATGLGMKIWSELWELRQERTGHCPGRVVATRLDMKIWGELWELRQERTGHCPDRVVATRLDMKIWGELWELRQELTGHMVRAELWPLGWI